MNLDSLFIYELNHSYSHLKKTHFYSIYDLYPDFDWKQYRELNPFLVTYHLHTEKQYTFHYLLQGRYLGYPYITSQCTIKSFHVLLATIGKKSIFSILFSLKKQLTEHDFLTIVFDGKEYTHYYEHVCNACKLFPCKVNIHIEEKNIGFWGHGIRNKYNDLEGDFVYHIDDDDHLYHDTFKNIRLHCVDPNMIYIFKIMLPNQRTIWKHKKITYGQISTQSCVIPKHINRVGYWGLRYGGDFDFYQNLSMQYPILFIPKIIYRKS